MISDRMTLGEFFGTVFLSLIIFTAMVSIERGDKMKPCNQHEGVKCD